jgi:glycosyltransferase involved in cell wall biosynthesis
MSPRVAFIDYFPIHYRVGLYEALTRRMEVDFYFFSDERERWHNPAIASSQDGRYHRVPVRRFRLGNQSVAPGVGLSLLLKRYDAVVKSLNGKIMLPLTYGAARASRTRFVLWTGMWYHPRTAYHQLTRPAIDHLYRRSDAIVTYGDHVKRFVASTPGVDERKIFTAGQAVNPERFAAVRRTPTDRPVALFIGQLEERKGLDVLLDAWDIAGPAVDGVLHLIGNGSLDNHIRQRFSRREDVEMLGYIPQADIPHYLGEAACLVLPSVTTRFDREPWGVVVNEAMHAAVPVIASDAVGAAAGGLVQDGVNGYVVPEGDVSALARALANVLGNRVHAEGLGNRAREGVALFTYDRMATAFQDAVAHAIGVDDPLSD